MYNENCIKCLMNSIQLLFVTIRSYKINEYNLILLGIYKRYVDSIPNLKPKDIAGLKNEIKDIDILEKGIKEDFNNELNVFESCQSVDDIQSIINNIPVLKDIINEIETVIMLKSHERVHDLADAVHNYPEMITKTNTWSPSDYWKVYIKPYRKKWDRNFLEKWKKNFL